MNVSQQRRGYRLKHARWEEVKVEAREVKVEEHEVKVNPDDVKTEPNLHSVVPSDLVFRASAHEEQADEKPINTPTPAPNISDDVTIVSIVHHRQTTPIIIDADNEQAGPTSSTLTHTPVIVELDDAEGLGNHPSPAQMFASDDVIIVSERHASPIILEPDKDRRQPSPVIIEPGEEERQPSPVVSESNEEVPASGSAQQPATLLPYQIKSADHLFNILSRGQRALDASDTGTGKTYVTIYNAKRLGLKPFVVCPKAIAANWFDVADQFGVELKGVAHYELLKGGKYFHNMKTKPLVCPWVEITKVESWEAVEVDETGESVDPKRPDYGLPPPAKRRKIVSYEFKFDFPTDTLIVFDEAHRCKNHHTANSKLLQSACDTKNKVLIISATIFDKVSYFTVFGMFFQLYDALNEVEFWLRRELLFLERTPSSKVDPEIQNLSKERKQLLCIHRALVPKYASRIQIKDLGKAFPRCQIFANCYYLDDAYKIARLYDDIRILLDQLRDELEKSRALGRLVKLRQLIEVLKVPIFIELAQNFLEKGLSVVIFANFSATIEQLLIQLNDHKPAAVWGVDSMGDRQLDIERFQSNKTRLMICNIKAGGEGLSFHDKHGGYRRVALFNPTWSAQDLVQALGRIHRAKGKSPVVQYLIYAKETYEEEICMIVKRKMGNYRTLNDGGLSGRYY
ncbi:hypothetical protein HDV00_003477 [Rhizophlyctis rosea]|nr:hypothetical protein HDV00_003477 [Rhizophlyctis rosea]